MQKLLEKFLHTYTVTFKPNSIMINGQRTTYPSAVKRFVIPILQSDIAFAAEAQKYMQNPNGYINELAGALLQLAPEASGLTPLLEDLKSKGYGLLCAVGKVSEDVFYKKDKFGVDRAVDTKELCPQKTFPPKAREKLIEAFPHRFGNTFTDMTHSGIGLIEGKSNVDWKLNLYTPPIQRCEVELLKMGGGESQEFKAYTDWIHHLLPNPKQVEAFNKLIKHTVTKGPVTNHFVVFQGAQGNGKTTLMDALHSVIGKQYVSRPASEFFESRFKQSELQGKQLVILDDFENVDRKKANMLKSISNRWLTSEKKYQESSTFKASASFILAYNARNAVPISWEDRRYSVYQLTSKTALEVFGQERIMAFVKAMKTPEFKRQWWNYYLNHVEEGVPEVFQDGAFDKLVAASLSSQQQWLYDQFIYSTLSGGRAMKEGRIDIKTIHEEMREDLKLGNQTSHRETIRNFLTSFNWKSKQIRGPFYETVDDTTLSWVGPQVQTASSKSMEALRLKMQEQGKL